MSPKKTSDGSAFVAEAYALSDSQSAIQFYRKWAGEYDANMQSLDYLSPQKVANLLAEYLTVENPQVLDVGCGTGLTGKEVRARISGDIDGIDISGEMIEVARSRDIYRNLIVGDLNLPLRFQDESFDAAISSGTFTHGHVGPQPLTEITRLLKPGGLLACTVHFDLWHTRGFDVAFACLISAGALECLSLEEGSYYKNAPVEGWFCLYQKKAKSTS